MDAYYTNVKGVVIRGFKRLNSTPRVEHMKWKVPVGSWEVSVVRGKVLEKATLSRIRLNTTFLMCSSTKEPRFNLAIAYALTR